VYCSLPQGLLEQSLRILFAITEINSSSELCKALNYVGMINSLSVAACATEMQPGASHGGWSTLNALKRSWVPHPFGVWFIKGFGR